MHEQIVPPSRPAPVPIEPYRLLFPMGLAFALLGGAVWPLYALGLIPYPGLLHATLMIQGFEQCFVVGFLLTAMPAFTHGPRCHPLELAVAGLAMAAFGASALAGTASLAQTAFLLSLTVLWTAGLRRIAGNERRPPEEFLFVAFGLALGTLGGALLLAGAGGASLGLPPRLPERLLSLGMVLSLVMGVGSLLVPTLAGMRDPLAIPGIASAHERRGRRTLYLAVIVALALAFVAEFAGRPRLGMTLRAVAVTTMGLWVWKADPAPAPRPARLRAVGRGLDGDGGRVGRGPACRPRHRRAPRRVSRRLRGPDDGDRNAGAGLARQAPAGPRAAGARSPGARVAPRRDRAARRRRGVARASAPLARRERRTLDAGVDPVGGARPAAVDPGPAAGVNSAPPHRVGGARERAPSCRVAATVIASM